MRNFLKYLPALLAMFSLVPPPLQAFHIVEPSSGAASTNTSNIRTVDWECFEQPILLGVDDVDGNTNLETAAHLGWMRITIRWSFVEASQGTFDFSRYQSAVDNAYSQGIKILAVLSTAPQWAGGGPDGTVPPSNISLWQTFVQMTAQHFAGKIVAYEIWNEPNFTDQGTGIGWNKDINTAPLYVDYLHAAAVDIRNSAPGTLVVGPVLSSQPDSRGTTIFNQIESASYSDGPGSKFMDVVSFHANAPGSDSSASMSQWISGHLNQINGSNRGKPIWITELGWASALVGESGQETHIFNLVDYTAGDLTPGGLDCQTFQWWKFTNVFIYAVQDGPNFTRGIFRQDRSPKPTVTNYTATLPTPAKHPSANYLPMTYTCNGRTCTFTNSWSQNASQTEYGWDFGDGTILGMTLGSRVVTHTFPAAGKYFVASGALPPTGGDPADIQMVTVP